MLRDDETFPVTQVWAQREARCGLQFVRRRWSRIKWHEEEEEEDEERIRSMHGNEAGDEDDLDRGENVSIFRPCVTVVEL